MSDQEDQTEYELERTREVVREAVTAQAAANQAAVDESIGAAETEAPEGWDAYTVEELKAELAARGLTVSGNKADLVDRLEEDDAGGNT